MLNLRFRDLCKMHTALSIAPFIDRPYLTDKVYQEFMDNPMVDPRSKEEVKEVLEIRVQYLGNDIYKFILRDFDIVYNMNSRRLVNIYDRETEREIPCFLYCQYAMGDNHIHIELSENYPKLLLIKTNRIWVTIFYHNNQFLIPELQCHKKLKVEDVRDKALVNVTISRFYNGNYKRAVKIIIDEITYIFVLSDFMKRIYNACVLENNNKVEFDYSLKGKTDLLSDKTSYLDCIISDKHREIIFRPHVWREKKLTEEEVVRKQNKFNMEYLSRGGNNGIIPRVSTYEMMELPKFTITNKDGSTYNIYERPVGEPKLELREDSKGKVSIDIVNESGNSHREY